MRSADPTFQAVAPFEDEGVKTEAPRLHDAPKKSWGQKSVRQGVVVDVEPDPQQLYPKMMYKADGRSQVALNADEEDGAKENGWTDAPSILHRERLQAGDGGASGRRLPVEGSDAKLIAKHDPLAVVEEPEIAETPAQVEAATAGKPVKAKK